MAKAPKMPINSKCVYCGTFATDWDHVIPNKLLRPFGGRKYTGDWLVPSCRDCNAMLGARAILSVPNRAEFLYLRYRVKYEKLMLSITWTDDDLAELGPNLQSLVLQTSLAQAELDHRLAHLRVIAAKPWDYMRPNENSVPTVGGNGSTSGD